MCCFLCKSRVSHTIVEHFVYRNLKHLFEIEYDPQKYRSYPHCEALRVDSHTNLLHYSIPLRTIVFWVAEGPILITIYSLELQPHENIMTLDDLKHHFKIEENEKNHISEINIATASGSVKGIKVTREETHVLGIWIVAHPSLKNRAYAFQAWEYGFDRPEERDDVHEGFLKMFKFIRTWCRKARSTLTLTQQKYPLELTNFELFFSTLQLMQLRSAFADVSIQTL